MSMNTSSLNCAFRQRAVRTLYVVASIAILSAVANACGGSDSNETDQNGAQGGEGGTKTKGAGGSAGKSAGPSANVGPLKIVEFDELGGQRSELRRTEFRYDKLGRVIEETYFDLDEDALSEGLTKAIETTFEYNTNGQVAKKSMTFLGTGSRYENLYNYENGRRMEDIETQFRLGKTETSVDTFSYDDSGRLTERKSEGIVKFTWTNTYDSKSRLISEHSAGGSSWADDTYSYDDKGKLTKWTTSYKGESTGDDLYSYDDNGWIQSVDRGSTVKRNVKTYFRNAAGILLKVETRLTNGTLVLTEEYEMSNEGSAHHWTKATGNPYPLQLDAAEMFGLPQNIYESTKSP
jgi:YD repeat-containing protein